MIKNTFCCIVFLMVGFSAKSEKLDPRIEIGIHFYSLDLENQLKNLNHILVQENFPTIEYLPMRCGTFTLNDQKQSADFKLGGGYQMLGNGDQKTRLQNVMLIVEYRYNIPFRNESWVFYPALAYGLTYGNFSLIQINQKQFDPSVGSIDVPDYFEKRYSFFTGFIHPKVGINYLFGINWFKTVKFDYSVGLEMGYQLAHNAKLRSANHSFVYTETPKFSLSGFTFGFNFRFKLPVEYSSRHSNTTGYCLLRCF